MKRVIKKTILTIALIALLINTSHGRYYDAQLSRWITVDPAMGEYFPHHHNQYNNIERLPGLGGIYNPINMNPYHYGANNPVKYIDPDGKAIVLASVLAAAIIITPRYINNPDRVNNQWVDRGDTPTTYGLRTARNMGLVLGGYYGGQLFYNAVKHWPTFATRIFTARATVEAARRVINHISRHIPSQYRQQVPHLINKFGPNGAYFKIKDFVEKNTFFNPNWRLEKVIKVVNKGYRAALKSGIANKGRDSFEYTAYGEKITFEFYNGALKTVFGQHRLPADYFIRGSK